MTRELDQYELRVTRELDQYELIDPWTLVDDELALVAGECGATRLGSAVLLCFYTDMGRFRVVVVRFRTPRWNTLPGSRRGCVGAGVLRLVGPHDQGESCPDPPGVGVPRVQCRRSRQVTEWLAANVTQVERSVERVRDALLARCREERVEQPTSGRVDRIVRSALHRGEELLVGRVAPRLPAEVRDPLHTRPVIRQGYHDRLGTQHHEILGRL